MRYPMTLLATIALAAGATRAEPPAFEIATPFPDLRLPDLDGQARSIADFRGRKIVLHVFASW